MGNRRTTKKGMLFSHPAEEPDNIETAIGLTESCHYFTLVNLETHRKGGLITGGYGHIYELLEKNEGYFRDLLTPELVKEGRSLTREQRRLEKDAERGIMLSKYKTVLFGKTRLAHKVANWAPYMQDEACTAAKHTFILDPRSTAHFERRAAYEEKVLAHLKTEHGAVWVNPNYY